MATNADSWKKLRKPELVVFTAAIIDKAETAQSIVEMQDQAIERFRADIRQLNEKVAAMEAEAAVRQKEFDAVCVGLSAANERIRRFNEQGARAEAPTVGEVEARLREGINQAEKLMTEIGSMCHRAGFELRKIRREAGKPGRGLVVRDVDVDVDEGE